METALEIVQWLMIFLLLGQVINLRLMIEDLLKDMQQFDLRTRSSAKKVQTVKRTW